MFDVGFWELALIGIVALLVIGPERLPAFARTVGLYVGKARRMVNQVRNDIEREIRSEELRRTFEESKALREAASSLDEARKSIQDSATESLETFRAEVDPDYRPRDKAPTEDAAGDDDPDRGDEPDALASAADGDEPGSASGEHAGERRDRTPEHDHDPYDDDDELPWPDELEALDERGEGEGNARRTPVAERGDGGSR